MRATGYLLNPTVGVNLPGATYGSGLYGTQTYGQTASDPVSAIRYIVVFDGGYPAYPAVRFQAGDQRPPITAQLLGADGVMVDFTGAATAELDLYPVDGQTTPPIVLPGTIDVTNRRLTFPLAAPAPPVPVGTYRARVRVTYTSTRRLTAPFDNSATVVIRDGDGAP